MVPRTGEIAQVKQELREGSLRNHYVGIDLPKSKLWMIFISVCCIFFIYCCTLTDNFFVRFSLSTDTTAALMLP